jgi:hypothetical protein
MGKVKWLKEFIKERPTKQNFIISLVKRHQSGNWDVDTGALIQLTAKMYFKSETQKNRFGARNRIIDSPLGLWGDIMEEADVPSEEGLRRGFNKGIL